MVFVVYLIKNMGVEIVEPKFVNKKQAKGNENVEYGETTVLHSSRQSEITLLPFFIVRVGRK